MALEEVRVVEGRIIAGNQHPRNSNLGLTTKVEEIIRQQNIESRATIRRGLSDRTYHVLQVDLVRKPPRVVQVYCPEDRRKFWTSAIGMVRID